MRGQKVWRKGVSAMTDRQKPSRTQRAIGCITDVCWGIWHGIWHDKWMILGVFVIEALVLTLLFPPPPILIWNASASAPIGLYYVDSWKRYDHQSSDIEIDDMVVAWPPRPARKFAAERHYLPSGVPLIKRVAAIDHDVVCADGDQITINGGRIVPRRKLDAKGRALPWWQGCHMLQEGEVFLMMEEHPASFDGRYFGVTLPKDIIGKATLIWAR
jgi:conjugative transfer signal peptidase TraF